MIQYTSSLRFLKKVCVQSGSSSPWMLCSVTEVEETKQMLRMLPILVTKFLRSVMVAQSNTLLIKQGISLDKRIGSHFQLPPASLGAFVTVTTMLVCVVLYDRVFVRINIRRWTKNPRGITLLQRMRLHIIIMIIACFTERYRLNAAKKSGVVENGEQVPLTILILLPQFVLMGVADACSTICPNGTLYSMTSVGIGNFLSSLILATFGRDGVSGC